VNSWGGYVHTKTWKETGPKRWELLKLRSLVDPDQNTPQVQLQARGLFFARSNSEV